MDNAFLLMSVQIDVLVIALNKLLKIFLFYFPVCFACPNFLTAMTSLQILILADKMVQQ